MQNEKATTKAAWLEQARCASLAEVGNDVDALVSDAASETRRELGELEKREDVSDFAKELEVDVRTEVAETELSHQVSTAVNDTRDALKSELDAGGATEAQTGEVVERFDRDAQPIVDLARSDFRAKVTAKDEGDEKPAAVSSFIEQMRAARAAAEQELGGDAAPSDSPSSSDSPSPSSSPSASLMSQSPSPAATQPHPSDHQPTKTPARRKTWMLMAGAGVVAAAVLAAVLVLQGDDDAPSKKKPAPQAKKRDEVAPLGAGKPERLRRWQEVRREKAKRERESRKRSSPVASTRAKRKVKKTKRVARLAENVDVASSDVVAVPNDEPEDAIEKEVEEPDEATDE